MGKSYAESISKDDVQTAIHLYSDGATFNAIKRQLGNKYTVETISNAISKVKQSNPSTNLKIQGRDTKASAGIIQNYRFFF
jgi:hypothetical protein